MKRFLALVLAGVMSLCLLTGCSDPVYDEFENFLNVEMVEINANYEKIKAEAASWTEETDVAALSASITDTLLPTVEDSLTKLAAIELETEEVKEIKNKYVKVMEAYKEGFETLLTAVETDDADKANAGNEKINEGMTLLNEYNTALEALAEELGGEIEY